MVRRAEQTLFTLAGGREGIKMEGPSRDTCSGNQEGAMNQQTLEQIENWCFAVRAGELEQYLTALRLKTSGSRFAKLTRLTARLLGMYTPEDLAES